ncbi:hypothetical protein BJY52DRAFT_1230493 [Lactarius psammicola]|nr:hypothetical protein BJY52DRAFT_1230493 [Lactarius psammicola]
MPPKKCGSHGKLPAIIALAISTGHQTISTGCYQCYALAGALCKEWFKVTRHLVRSVWRCYSTTAKTSKEGLTQLESREMVHKMREELFTPKHKTIWDKPHVEQRGHTNGVTKDNKTETKIITTSAPSAPALYHLLPDGMMEGSQPQPSPSAIVKVKSADGVNTSTCLYNMLPFTMEDDSPPPSPIAQSSLATAAKGVTSLAASFKDCYEPSSLGYDSRVQTSLVRSGIM